MRSQAEREEVVDGLIGELTAEQLSLLVVERERKRNHAAAKLTQPEVTVDISDHHWQRIVADFKRPLSQEEREAQGLDLLLVTLKDCMRANNKEDTLFAALRVARWCWAHLPSQYVGDISSR